MKTLTPSQIVEALDTCITGQAAAKRSLALEIRNRWRREQAHICHPDDPAPYRYLVTGPRGVGKSALIRHVAQALDAPFVRVTTTQILAAGTPKRAARAVLEQLVESALVRAGNDDIESAIREMEQNAIILIDRLDHWGTPASDDDHKDDGPDTVSRYLRRLAGTLEHATRYGKVSTANIMLFATGDITTSRNSGIPEDLQAIFPRHIDLEALSEEDLLEILASTGVSPINDIIALLAAEGLRVHFTQDGIEAIAAKAAEQNQQGEDIGAQRLMLVVETVLDDLLFNGADSTPSDVTIDAAYVNERIAIEADNEDLDDFIL